MRAGTIGVAETIECKTTKRIPGLSLADTRRLKYSASNSVPAGETGTIYPGSFDFEREKKTTGTISQMIRNTLRASSDASICCRSARQTRKLSASDASTQTVHGIKPISVTGMKYHNGSGW